MSLAGALASVVDALFIAAEAALALRSAPFTAVVLRGLGMQCQIFFSEPRYKLSPSATYERSPQSDWFTPVEIRLGAPADLNTLTTMQSTRSGALVA